jgi:uncharacterized protein YukE
VSRFGVDLERLDAFPHSLAGCEQRLCAARSEIDAAVREAHSDWRGSAAAAHADAHRRWAAGEAGLREALAAMQEIAATAAANYTAAVGAGTRIWSR